MMPKGVEYDKELRAGYLSKAVRIPMMPKGVEHRKEEEDAGGTPAV